ncbi:MAG: lysophospholipid acyltransferase family protein, partial [Gaiellaceae bacterium]
MNFYAVLDRVGFRPFMRWIYRMELVHAERIPATGGCIVASNHESIVDPFILGVATPREIRYMAKSELFRRRWMAAAMRSFGAFPVERGGGDRVAFSDAAEMLRRGAVLGIFPQGTSKQHAMRPWHRGAARLALTTGVPVVPVRLTGTRGLPVRT